MECVFVTENPIDINRFVNECNEVQKLKIGEIFQSSDSSLSMCCLHCLLEFQYFTEFSLHIQEHFVRGEVADLKEIRESDSIKPYDDRPTQYVNTHGTSDPKAEIGIESEFPNNELEIVDAWPGGEIIDNSHSIFEPEINVRSFEKLPETPSFVDGTDYEKIKSKYRCLTCSHETPNWDHFKDHLLTHTNVRNVLCPICAKAFSAISYVRKHVNRTHKMKITANKIREAQPMFNGPIIISTVKPITTKTFVEGEDYEKSNGRFKCLTCGREMLDHVKEHLLTHSNEKNVFCPMCSKPFIAVSYVRKHVNRAHKMKITADEIKAAQSPFHPSHKRNRVKRSITPVVLCQNKIENPEKHFECFDCHRQFTGLSSLRIHLKLHSGIKYDCPHCVKVFAMRSYVRDHIVAMHGIRREEIPKNSIRQAIAELTPELNPPNDERFPCSLCKNQYNKKQTLRQHVKTHTSGPFLCVTCGAVYKSIANLRYHANRRHGKFI